MLLLLAGQDCQRQPCHATAIVVVIVVVIDVIVMVKIVVEEVEERRIKFSPKEMEIN